MDFSYLAAPFLWRGGVENPHGVEIFPDAVQIIPDAVRIFPGTVRTEDDGGGVLWLAGAKAA